MDFGALCLAAGQGLETLQYKWDLQNSSWKTNKSELTSETWSFQVFKCCWFSFESVSDIRIVQEKSKFWFVRGDLVIVGVFQPNCTALRPNCLMWWHISLGLLLGKIKNNTFFFSFLEMGKFNIWSNFAVKVCSYCRWFVEDSWFVRSLVRSAL